MAIPSARLIQDQNIGARFTGGAVLGEKTDGSKAQKKGGLGSRKALNDISNSVKPSGFQLSKKHNSSDVITIDRDTGAAATKTPFVVSGKLNGSKQTQKGQSGGRKALSDLTNSGKPSLQKVAKSSQGNKLTVLSEDFDIEKEGFLHNHQECVKARKTVMDKDRFVKLVGLDDGPLFRPPASKLRPQSPSKLLEMEEMPVPFLGDDRVESPVLSSLACLSPVSPRLSSAFWDSLCEDSILDFTTSAFWDSLCDFTIIESPKHPKAGLIL